jgi:hypothetical protein
LRVLFVKDNPVKRRFPSLVWNRFWLILCADVFLNFTFRCGRNTNRLRSLY